MTVRESTIAGLLILETKVFSDERGFFMETYREESSGTSLPKVQFVQDNFSRSNRNVLRGLHFQKPQTQCKLIRVTRGAVWDVAVDLRKNSPTFGQHFALELSENNHLAFYIPEGFAHGFCTLSDTADFLYKCSDYYAPAHDQGLRWNDPKLNIEWPVKNPIVSGKDAQLPTLEELVAKNLTF